MDLLYELLRQTVEPEGEKQCREGHGKVGGQWLRCDDSLQKCHGQRGERMEAEGGGKRAC